MIMKTFCKGWKTTFPLTILAPSFLDSPDAECLAKAIIKAASNPSMSTTSNADAQAVLKLIQDKLAMDLATWVAAWSQLLELIQTFLPTSAFSAWQQHWQNIWSWKDNKWHCLVEYDICTRSYATQQNFDPGHWNADLWDEIVDRDQDCIAAGQAPPTIIPTAPSHLAGAKASTSTAPPPYASVSSKPGSHTATQKPAL
ncbi:hypothetical protein FRC11_007481, partial [Ceratobasidium sp. 423]